MKSKISIFALAFAPLLAAAQQGGPESFAKTIDGFLGYLVYLGGRIMPLLILAALVFFLFGIFKLFFYKADGAKDAENRKFVLWGIIALFVMVSVWGLVNVLARTLNLDNVNIPPPPAVPYQNSPRAVPNSLQ